MTADAAGRSSGSASPRFRLASALILVGALGGCADCGADIPFVRLQANPLATRCTACQGKFERTHAQVGHAKL